MINIRFMWLEELLLRILTIIRLLSSHKKVGNPKIGFNNYKIKFIIQFPFMINYINSISNAFNTIWF